MLGPVGSPCSSDLDTQPGPSFHPKPHRCLQAGRWLRLCEHNCPVSAPGRGDALFLAPKAVTPAAPRNPPHSYCLHQESVCAHQARRARLPEGQQGLLATAPGDPKEQVAHAAVTRAQFRGSLVWRPGCQGGRVLESPLSYASGLIRGSGDVGNTRRGGAGRGGPDRGRRCQRTSYPAAAAGLGRGSRRQELGDRAAGAGGVSRGGAGRR